MTSLVIPFDDQIAIQLSSGGPLVYKKPMDVLPGEYAWSFVIEAYSPSVRGHFKFVKVTDKPILRKKEASTYRWFNKTDGPILTIPKEWVLFLDGIQKTVSESVESKAYAFPGYLHDEIPLAMGFELFSDCFSNKLLTEVAAYFLGAFALRPQCYIIDNDTWGIFPGTTFNPSGHYSGGNQIERKRLAVWLERHQAAVTQLAVQVWGTDGFLIERKASRLGITDIPIPAPHMSSRFFQRSDGFAVHAPIGKGKQMTCKALASDPELRDIQYWYACLNSHLLERTSISVRKAFLLGAFDTISNADKDRKSLGCDLIEKFEGVFPLYSIIHSVGRNLLDTFEQSETRNPRRTASRTRGRIPRCKIWEATREIGFISEMKFERALEYEPQITETSKSFFPFENSLSVIMNTCVSTVTYESGHGSRESDLAEHLLYCIKETENSKKAKMQLVLLPIEEENVVGVSSLPLGAINKPSHIPQLDPSQQRVRLARSGWQDDALSRIYTINQCLPPWNTKNKAPSNDQIFEFLVAIVISCLASCRESWVVRRSDDQGVDVGARFSMDESLGQTTVIFQAKLQAKPVGRRIIDGIRGAMHREGASMGYVVTNNKYTKPARTSAKRDFPHIRLIEGQDLVQMMVRYKVGLHTTGSSAQKRFFLDLTFFEALRNLIIEDEKFTGRIFVYKDPTTDMPRRRG